ncbi:ankyrin repeat-containing protein [Besnoitia besnoiti]|uniref:Ankyrin repeat-containing protein n=1 Tax=Besnoitia besnoiti TaxID=94643 RepID=A0A2A9MA16_BESBE|nr:ankyrin repeat-containing protein [Besnoitia besnoiti]PFH32457.1 ankyrin repeat-containing protein [Besnoitia besnoiti]
MQEAGRKLVLAARDGELRDCKELLKLLPAIDFAEPPLTRTAFWHAAWKGHESVCRLLLEKGAAINHQDFEGRTPLHEAAYHGHAHIVKFLLENDAAIDMPDAAGETPLMRAVRGRRIEVVEILLKNGAKTNIVTPDELTSFHLAAFEGQPELAKCLFYRGSWRNRFSLQERIEAGRVRQSLADQSSLSDSQATLEGNGVAEATDAADDPVETESLEEVPTPQPEIDEEKEQDAVPSEASSPRSSCFGAFDDPLRNGEDEFAQRSIHSEDSFDNDVPEVEAKKDIVASGVESEEGETEDTRDPRARIEPESSEDGDREDAVAMD